MSAVNDSTPAGPTPPGADGIQASPSGAEGIQTGPAAAGATAIQTAPAPEAPPVPLPPRPRPAPLSPEELARAVARLDRMLVVLVLLFTFLVALFPVRNSDFWLHLATARDWLQGKMALGEDPYTYTGSGAWVNHSWLYEVLVYAFYQWLGGPAVIVVKAVLLTALTGLMLSIRRRGQSVWIPGVCTALAILVMSPAFLLQPMVVSLVLLGVTVALLLRRELREAPADTPRRRPPTLVPWLGEPADRPLWLLPPLFALWVNLDAWFFVGPLAVALYLMGSLLQAFFARGTPLAPRPGAWRPLAAVLAAGVVACLLNPFSARALTPLVELRPGGAVAQLGQDDMFATLLCSPLQGEYFQPEMGLNIAGLAYFALVLVAVLSVLCFRSTAEHRWGRALLGVGFLLLSLGQARTIPFFAVVAGPIAALNFQDYAARRFGTALATDGRRKEWALLGRGLSVLGAFTLAALAWPGWLFGFPNEDRRVRLEAEPPAGMVKLAKQLDEWHRDGTRALGPTHLILQAFSAQGGAPAGVPAGALAQNLAAVGVMDADAFVWPSTLRDGDRGLNLQPHAADVLAWLCTEHRQKCFFDDRFGNFPPDVAEDYVKVRQAFEPVKEGEKWRDVSEKWDDCQPILRKRNITYVIASDPPRGSFQVVRLRCALATPYLVTIYQDGHTAVYRPREEPLTPRGNAYLRFLRERGLKLPLLRASGEDAGRFKGREFDPWAMAFGPKAEPLPDQKPRRPQPLAWWMRFAFGPGPRAAESADAATYLTYFEETAFRHYYEHSMRPRSYPSFGFLTGASAVRTGNALADACVFGLRCRVVLGMEPPMEFDGSADPVFVGSSAPVLLAIRSARRAILYNPDDAEAYHQLGFAYLLLSRRTEERHFTLGRRLQLLPRLRNAQAMAALRKATLLDPDNVEAQYHLALVAERAGFLDLQLKHLAEFLRAERRGRPGPGQTEDQFQEHLKKLEKEHTRIEKDLSENQNKYEVRSSGKPVWEKAQIALSLGLGEKALQVLLDSTAVEFGAQGARLELDLLLGMGRLDELRNLLAPENDPKTREEMPGDLNSKLGIGSYEQYRSLLAAAEGDYKEADTFLEQAQTKVLEDAPLRREFRRQFLLEGKEPGEAKDLDLRPLMALSVARILVENVPVHGPAAWLALHRMLSADRLRLASQLAGPLQNAADYETIRGILKLESGHVPEAEKHFRKALFGNEAEKAHDAQIVLDFPGVLAAFRYLQMIEKKE